MKLKYLKRMFCFTSFSSCALDVFSTTRLVLRVGCMLVAVSMIVAFRKSGNNLSSRYRFKLGMSPTKCLFRITLF